MNASPPGTHEPDVITDAPTTPRPLILGQAEASRRMLLLAELQSALAGLGVRGVLARKHRLVLLYNRSQCEPSGLTDPQLHIFAPSGIGLATTDGSAYILSSGEQVPASDPGAAAAAIVRGHRIAPRTQIGSKSGAPFSGPVCPDTGGSAASKTP